MRSILSVVPSKKTNVYSQFGKRSDVSVTGGTNAGGAAMVATAIRETELTSPYEEEKVIPPPVPAID